MRESAGLTQAELADKSGVKRSFIALLESDKRTPPLGCLTQLSKALGLGRNEALTLMELGALRHLKPDIRPIISAALARIHVIDFVKRDSGIVMEKKSANDGADTEDPVAALSAIMDPDEHPRKKAPSYPRPSSIPGGAGRGK